MVSSGLHLLPTRVIKAHGLCEIVNPLQSVSVWSLVGDINGPSDNSCGRRRRIGK